MPYRILQYENEIMKSAIDYKKLGQKGYKLPLIISTVLYTGKKQWNANTYIRESQEKLEYADELQFAKYNIVDINEMNNRELFEEKSIISKILILEKSKNNEELIININKIINKIKDDNFYTNDMKEILLIILNLILKKKIGDEKTEELIKVLKGENKNMLAVLEMIEKDNKRILKKGIAQGRKESKIEYIKNMLKENLPINLICKITGMTEKEIEKIKKEGEK